MTIDHFHHGSSHLSTTTRFETRHGSAGARRVAGLGGFTRPPRNAAD
jgi:hypothetical protein